MTKQELIDAFIAGARWARMASDRAFDDELLQKDAAYFANSGGDIQCRGDGALRYFLRKSAN